MNRFSFDDTTYPINNAVTVLGELVNRGLSVKGFIPHLKALINQGKIDNNTLRDLFLFIKKDENAQVALIEGLSEEPTFYDLIFNSSYPWHPFSKPAIYAILQELPSKFKSYVPQIRLHKGDEELFQEHVLPQIKELGVKDVRVINVLKGLPKEFWSEELLDLIPDNIDNYISLENAPILYTYKNNLLPYAFSYEELANHIESLDTGDKLYHLKQVILLLENSSLISITPDSKYLSTAIVQAYEELIGEGKIEKRGSNQSYVYPYFQLLSQTYSNDYELVKKNKHLVVRDSLKKVSGAYTNFLKVLPPSKVLKAIREGVFGVKLPLDIFLAHKEYQENFELVLPYLESEALRELALNTSLGYAHRKSEIVKKSYDRGMLYRDDFPFTVDELVCKVNEYATLTSSSLNGLNSIELEFLAEGLLSGKLAPLKVYSTQES